MRRCGRVSCFFGLGLLVATLVVGGAFAAPGGNGKGHSESHEGKGLALAKGHAKHAAAAPQLPQAPPETAVEPKAAKHDDAAPKAKAAAPKAKGTVLHRAVTKSSPRATRRADHLTICHRTGSGRYIVISPSVNGVMNGHFKHHDDFVYVDGCLRPTPAPGPGPNPGPNPPPDSDGGPPSVRPHPGTGPARTTAEELPFTGVPLVAVLLGGFALVMTGLALRLRGRPRADNRRS